MKNFTQFISSSAERLTEQEQSKKAIRGVSAKAFAAEKAAYTKLQKKLNSPAFASPAGADAGFPDFGFTVELEDKRKVDIHIEYKASAREQMGSMRDWQFNGRQFSTPDKRSNTKDELIALMNNTPDAIRNGKRLLNDLQKYVSSSIRSIYSGSLTVIKDKEERKQKTQEFAKNTENFAIAKISNETLGDKILDHYKAKFKKSIRSSADASILMMMLGNDMWYIDTQGRLSSDDIRQIAGKFQVNNFNKMSGLSANLEVRIQPRGLNSPNKHASIDVMASFRLGGAPGAGVKVL